MWCDGLLGARRASWQGVASRCAADAASRRLTPETAQEELFGPGGGASDSTLLRVLDEFADRLGRDGLPGRRLARAMARAAAWAAIVARHGQLPAVRVASRDLVRSVSSGPVHPAVTASEAAARPVLVIRLDVTLIEAPSPKAQAAGHYKGGYGFHPLGSWSSSGPRRRRHRQCGVSDFRHCGGPPSSACGGQVISASAPTSPEHPGIRAYPKPTAMRTLSEFDASQVLFLLSLWRIS